MPNAPKTQHRSVRVPDDVWEEVKDRSHQLGTSGGELVRQFLEWWLRKPGAKMPKRPPASSE